MDRGHCHWDRDAGSEKEQQHLVRSTLYNAALVAVCCTASIRELATKITKIGTPWN